MFNYDLAHWSTFFLAAFLLNLSPGPDFAFILSHTVKGGKRAGTAAMLGIWTGAFGHVIFAALGLSAIIAASSTAFTIVKWVGVIYLVWLGIKAIRSDGGNLLIEKGTSKENFATIFRQGVLIDLFNPKVATFFLAFLPQFVVKGAGPVWAQLMLHGTLIIVAAAIVEPPLIFVGDKMTYHLRQSRSLRVWLDRTLGGVLIGLGLRLAVTER